MTRHDIRLRRRSMTSRRIERHKNYESLLNRHERSNRLRKTFKAVVYILALLAIIMLIYFKREGFLIASDAPNSKFKTELKFVPIGSSQ